MSWAVLCNKSACTFALKIFLELLTYILSDLFIGRSVMRCHLNVMYFVTRVAAMNVPGICVSRWMDKVLSIIHLEQFCVTVVLTLLKCLCIQRLFRKICTVIYNVCVLLNCVTLSHVCILFIKIFNDTKIILKWLGVLHKEQTNCRWNLLQLNLNI